MVEHEQTASISDAAMDLFADYLERREAGEGLTLDEVQEAHPKLAAELALLERQHRRLYERRLIESAVQDRRREVARDASLELEEVLARLQGRERAYRRYRILGELAEGGMGKVLRIYDRDLRRELAMKVLRNRAGGRRGSRAFDAVRAGRLLDEAQITAQLDHPGIPPVHEVGLAPDGELYFTMKLIASERTLEDVVEELHASEAGATAWPLPRVLGFVQRACEAVAYAHERGVIHRDLKPSNVLIGDFGEVYVTDWGVARVLDADRARDLLPRPEDGRGPRHVRSLRGDRRRPGSSTALATLHGRTVGTPEYMSPEQARGEELDRRADVYSMGALLYHVLSGRPPYRQEGFTDDRERLARVSSAPPRPLRELARGVAPELEAICERAMARDPAARYADMQALARDLAAYLEGRVVAAHRTGPVAELRKWVRRNRPFAIALVLTVLAVFAGSLAFVRSLTSERARGRLLTQMQLVLAAQSLQAGNAGARGQLDKVPEDARDWEWRHMLARCDTSMRLFDAHTGGVECVVVGPSGGWAISGSDDGTWRKWDTSSGAELLSPVPAEPREAVQALALSPDGAWLATLGPSRLAVWSTASGEPHPEFPQRLLVDLDPGMGRSVAFSPDGRALASFSGDRRIVVWSLDGGARLQEWGIGITNARLAWPSATELVTGISERRGLDGVSFIEVRDPSTGAFVRRWSVDGGLLHGLDVHPHLRWVATASSDGVLRVYELDDGRIRASLAGHGNAALSVAFDATGTRLASGSEDRSVRLWSLDTCAPIAVLAGHEDAVRGVALARGKGSAGPLVSASSDRTARVWSLDQEPGVTRLSGHYRLGCVCFAPDARLVAAGTDSFVVQLWNADDALGVASLRGHRDRINALAFTPDQRLLVSASADHELRVWDTSTFACRQVLKGHADDVNGVVVDPEGTRAVSSSRDGTVRLWDLASGIQTATLHEGEQRFTRIVWSADGKSIVAGTEAGEILVLRPGLSADVRVVPVSSGPVTCLALDAGGRILVGGEGGAALLLDGRTHATLLELRHAGPVRGCAVTPDGARIVTASDDRTLIVWDDLGVPLASFPLSSHPIDLAFAPDRRRLATVHFDAGLRLWEEQSPRELELRRRPLRELWQELAPRVQALFDEHAETGAVLEAIARAPDLDPEQLAQAQRMARWRVNDPATLAGEALDCVLELRDRERYEQALRKMELALQEQPETPLWEMLLGAVHARLDDPETALALLPEHGAPQAPNDRVALACLALRTKSLCAMGALDEARDCAATLRARVQAQVDWRGDAVVEGLLREVDGWISEGARR